MADQSEFRETITALLVFADLIDSSKYSSVLGYTEYARRLSEFQNLFTDLGKKYFPQPDDPSNEYVQVMARGDEGTIFYASASADFSELIFRAIELLYHLKGRLKFPVKIEDMADEAPRQLGMGAGIHVGRVAFATERKEMRSIISKLEGFSINYAKRIESSSRLGKYSRIFLSKEAARMLEGKPVILSKLVASMKGIEENAEVYEVAAGLFSGLKIDLENPTDAHLQEEFENFANLGIDAEEPWINSLAVSFLDCLIASTPVSERRSEYRKCQLNLAWRSTIEDDPLLLYIRAMDYLKKKEITQHIKYLRLLLQKHPEFIFARKKLINACWEIANGKSEMSEKVFARDMAKEFLEHFPNLLTDNEIKEFKKIIGKTEKKRK